LGRHADALKLFEEALAGYRQILTPDQVETLWSMRWVASALLELKRSTEAIPLIDECVSLAKSEDRSWVALDVLKLRMRHFQGTNDPVGCRTTAEMWEKLNHSDARSLYDAACFRAVTASTLRASDRSTEAAKSADAEAERSMTWLGKAVAAGFTDVALMRRDRDLDALRDRPDFKKLLDAMEAK
jgi:hypothetical protein